VRPILTRIRGPQKWPHYPPTEGRSLRAHSGIKCDMDDADKLFLLASRVYPEALEDIIKAIARVKPD
jgi:hypothetical protein